MRDVVGGGAGPRLGRWAVLTAIAVAAGAAAWSAVGVRQPAEPVEVASEPAPTAEPTTEPPEPTTPVTTSPATEATTEPVPAPTTEPPALGVPARPAETPEEVRAVYDELHLATVALLGEPREEDVDSVISRLCNCYDNYVERVAELAAAGHRMVSEPRDVLAFEIRGRTSNPDGWDLEVVLTEPDRDIVDSSGQLIEVFPGGPPERLHVAIIQEDGLWKFSLIGLIEVVE